MTIMLAGVVLNLVCVAVALAGVDVMHFWLALVLLGVGWNFMFVGATTLLTESTRRRSGPRCRASTTRRFSSRMVVSSLSSGALFTLQGWEAMNAAAHAVPAAGGGGDDLAGGAAAQPRQRAGVLTAGYCVFV